MTMISLLPIMFFGLLMILAIASDIRSMTIPNELNLTLAAGFAVFALLYGMPFPGWIAHLATGLVALAITAASFSLGWMGGGDAKLIAATALWFGPGPALFDYLVLASLFGGILTLSLILGRVALRPTTGVIFLDRLLSPANGIPYGVALGAAGLLVAVDLDWTLVFA